jgi:hypothetical protein
LRAALDCAGRAVLAARVYPAAAGTIRALATPLAAAGAGLALAALMPTIAAALGIGLLAALAFCALAWRALVAEERSALILFLRNPAAVLRR